MSQQLQIKQKSRKILAITLYELQNLINNVHDVYQISYRGVKFEFLVLVLRYVGANDSGEVLFTDDTGVFKYQQKRVPHSSSLSKGSYYQLTLTLKSMNHSFQPHLQNIQLTEGNSITTHIMHILQQQIQQKTLQLKQQNGSIRKSQTENNEKQAKQQIQYDNMKSWIESREQFMYDDIIAEFGEVGVETLARMEDEGIVGNMGEGYYRAFI